MTAVRPEFRVDIYVPERGALVFGTAPCRVPGCVRQPRTRGLCKGHYYQWKAAGRPGIEEFAATASPKGLGRKELTVCVVPGCRYGGAAGACRPSPGVLGTCGKPDRTAVAGWTRPCSRSRPPGLRAVLLHTVDAGHAHGSASTTDRAGRRWAGRPSSEFAVLCESYGDDRFDFRPLGDRRQLKLELQYALQCRNDERQVKTPAAVGTPGHHAGRGQPGGPRCWTGHPGAVERVLRRPPRGQARGRTGSSRSSATPRPPGRPAPGQRLEAEFPRDVWELRRLGIEGRKRLRFDGIPAALAAPPGRNGSPAGGSVSAAARSRPTWTSRR